MYSAINDAISVTVPTSPTPYGDNLEGISKHYEAIRYHLPTAPIYILADGVREEEQSLTEIYERYKERLILYSKNVWTGVTIVQAPEWLHEAGQIRRFMDLNLCSSPLILNCQHDFIFTQDFIDWPGIVDALLKNEISCARFTQDDGLPKGKEHLYRGTMQTSRGLSFLLIAELYTCAALMRRDFLTHLLSYFETAKCHLDGDEAQPFAYKMLDAGVKMGVYLPPEGSYGYCRVNHEDFRRLDLPAWYPKFPTKL